MPKVKNENDPLLQKKQYSGKVYRVAGVGDSKDLEAVQAKLDGRVIEHGSGDEYTADDSIEVPDVFKNENGEVRIITTTNDVEHLQKQGLDVVTGLMILDEPSIVSFREKEILVLDTVKIRFSLFESNGAFYLAMIGKRDLVDSILTIINDDLRDMSITVSEISIKPQGIENIAEYLADELLDTTFEDYPQNTIDKKRIWGQGYEGEPEYEAEKKRGEVHGHMMATTELADGQEKVISVSDDALIRSYSNLTLHTYINMLSDYILPHVTSQSMLQEFTEGESS